MDSLSRLRERVRVRVHRAARFTLTPHRFAMGPPSPARGRAKWVVPACLVLFYLAAVLSRAHFAAPPPTPMVFDRHGVFLAQFGDAVPARDGRELTEYGYWPVDPPPARVVRATLALEDRHFWSHPGVDPGAVLRAAWQDLHGLRRRSGASTIAMQVARMQHPEARSLWAKAVEAGTALALTVRYGRAAVLAQYLRLVPYGNGSHGIGHAARWYFAKPAADLSWAEIALLCAVPRAPAAYNPLRPAGLVRARARAGRILEALRSQAVVTEAEYAAATAQLAVLRPGPAPQRPADALHVVLRLRDMLAAEPPAAADGGGAAADDRVTAALDLGVQHMVAGLLHGHLAGWRAAGAQQVAVIVVQRGDNAVLAAVGSDGYGDPRGGAIDFTRAVRSPGSTLKPFLYAAALQRGLLHPGEMLEDAPGRSAGISNADARYLGPVPPRQALANSRNVPAVDVLRRLGLGAGFDLFRALGLQTLDAAPDSLGLAMAIGALPTSLDRLADAYAALADDGMARGLRWYRGQPEAAPRRVFATVAAREVGLFLSDPLARLPSFARYGSTEYPFPVAVKTGTSQGYRDAWTVAWSPRFLVGAWVGRADAGTMAGLGGVSTAAELVRSVLLALHHAVPGELADTSLAVPDGYVAAPVCAGPAETPSGPVPSGPAAVPSRLVEAPSGPVEVPSGPVEAPSGPAEAPKEACARTLQEWVPRGGAAGAGAAELAGGMAAARVPEAAAGPGLGAAAAGPVIGPAAGMVAGQGGGTVVRAGAMPVADAPVADAPVQLSVVTPEAGSRIWRNPESPPAANRLVLRAKVRPHVPQVVWYVDGAPFALSDPDVPVSWPLHAGEHRFQVGLPLRPERSRAVRLEVQ